MNYTKTTGSFPSSNRADNIAYYVYRPEGEAKALIQLSHGMCEYIARYEEFIDFLCGNGFAVIANDHLGHGNSAACKDDLGYFAVRGGWIYLINDLHRTSVIGRRLFKGLPHYVIGHSMGSLILRCYLAKYSSEIDGAVIVGTVGPNPALPAAKLLADSEIVLHGVKSRSQKINNLMFGYACSRIKNNITDFDWLTRDEAVVDKYVNDEKCNFVFTASAFRDLFMLLDYCSDRSWYKKVRKDIPLMLLAGGEDPIGGYGKGVMQVFKGLTAHGFSDVEIKICEGCRHEVFNELNKKETYGEVLHWLDVRLKRQQKNKGKC
ncbi:MAG: alpha/beta hydrolase [Oscillospiraceae bacterium]|nr:alpha/beta hydrolase [Oscillospiraceae bacterium]